MKLKDKIKEKAIQFHGKISKGLTKDGYEEADPKPTHVKLGITPKRPESLDAMVKRMILQQTTYYAMENGYETPEEADDFDCDDDFDPKTPYESYFDPKVPDEVIKQDVVAKKLLKKGDKNENNSIESNSETNSESNSEDV